MVFLGLYTAFIWELKSKGSTLAEFHGN